MLSLTVRTLGVGLASGFTGHTMTSKAKAVHTEGSPMQKLEVSDNKRFLVKEDGTPFVWIGDTLWVWQKLTLSEIEEYLLKRKEQGLNIVQVRLAGRPNDRTFNSEGEAPFLAKNRHGQYVLTKPNPKYWSYMDKMIEKFAEHEIYLAPVLMWGHHWLLEKREEDELYRYAKWVGHRYRDAKHIIWMTLGEGNHGGVCKPKVMAAINGLRDGDTGNKLITIHAAARMGTSTDFHHELDFNTWQTSQWCAPTDLTFGAKEGNWWTEEGQGDLSVWEVIARDYNRQPTKPVIDAEAWYEGPSREPPENVEELKPKPREFGQGYPSQSYHVRRRAYFTVFAGAFGHTYGAHGLWIVNREEQPTWREAMEYPGTDQMQYLGRLLKSKPALTRIPDQSMIVGGQSNSYNSHIQATRDANGSYAFVYVADGHEFSLDLTGMSGSKVIARWYSPRDGKNTDIGTIERTRYVSFHPPGTPHFTNDWVLVLEADGE